jgi:UDP-N-acetylglucosamine 1-carboxyvinyltransferase
MDKFIISGGRKIVGEIKVSGAKNVAMKVILVGLLTSKPIYVKNVPLISSVYGTLDIVKPLGVKVKVYSDHALKIQGDGTGNFLVPLELGGRYRTATMVMGPLLARYGKAIVPNPGGCRLGKRSIERHIDGLQAMGAEISYRDGYFVAVANGLHGAKYRFPKNTHTGTESLILAAVEARGETILENASQEPEVDDLIRLLTIMGAKVRRTKERTIVIEGVKKLTGAEFTIMPDRNEVVTYACGALASGGDVTVIGTQREYLKSFLAKVDEIGGGWEPIDGSRTRFYSSGKLAATEVTTAFHPGFMTDWQSSWALLMTQADGVSTIHETIFEDRFGYVSELRKMGADIEFFAPNITHPQQVYNFNWTDKDKNTPQAIRIKGPTPLHDAVMEITDLRAGATLVLAASIATGESVIWGVEHIDRGYEKIGERLTHLGVKIKRIKEK